MRNAVPAQELKGYSSTTVYRNQKNIFKNMQAALRIPGLYIGGTVLLIIVIAAALAPILTRYDPNGMNMQEMLRPPSAVHWFGTDNFGRDIFTRELYALRLSLLIGFCVAAATGVIGTVFGMIAGFVRPADAIIMRIADGFMAFPWMVLAIATMAFLGSSVTNVIIVLSIVYSPRMLRIVRSSVLVEREKEYVTSAITVGASKIRTAVRHVLPNAVAPMIIQLTFTFAYAVLNESLLDFLGVGVPPSFASLGKMISESEQYMIQSPWTTLFPGLGIAVVVLCLNFLGDGIQDLIGKKSGG
ncbi:ABC transporter permease [Alicyclobacillus macrosporangiidus]|uniref:ABC transporter permease n=1 Tax=Alicyclobacillus macrosporangiidus TaxID=392015 RepID=UPI00049703B7|nr:ABC transporter permease [Alicyclobacillus macrosporangiidus]